MGKPLELVVINVTGVEVKEKSDQTVVGSRDRKSVCSLTRLSSWTVGELDDDFSDLPPESSEIPWRSAPEAVSSAPLGRIAGETVTSKGCQLGLKPRPVS